MESDPSLVFNNCSHVSKQDTPTNPSDLISINIKTLEARTKKQFENESESGGREHHIVLDHSVVPKGHNEMALSLPERRWKEDQLNTKRGGNKSIHEVPCCSYSGPAYKLEFPIIGKGLNFSEKQSRSGIWGLEENHLSLLPQNRFLFGLP